MKSRVSFTSLLALGTLAGLMGMAHCAQMERLPSEASSPTFVIGPEAGDPHSHAAFPHLPHDIIKVSSRVRVTSAADHGLNFFAIQVNFPNKTWAHGGPQRVGGKYQMNWGGLVSRGGGSTDYREENPTADLQLLQNAENSERSAPYAWEIGKDYILTIERGNVVTLPPGPYVFIGSGPVVSVSNARTMWEWKFTLRPVDGRGPVQVSTLYDTADRISSFYIWNECGTCGKAQSATWTMPIYNTLSASNKELQAQVLKRF